MNYIECRVKKFKKEFKLKGIPNVDDLKNILSKLSYSLLPSDEMKSVLTPKEIASLDYSSSITITKGQKHYTFYDSSICESDLPFILAHEIGHIYLNHLNRNDGYNDTLERKQREANEFATYLMNEKTKNYLTPIISVISVVIILHLLTVISALKEDIPNRTETSISVIPFTDIEENEDVNIINSSEEVIVTSTGTKYHKTNCGHIKNRKNLKTISIKEATELGYEECLDCF